MKVAEYHPDLSKKYKFYMVPSRWVHELYPVDEIVPARSRHREGRVLRSSWSSDPKDIYTVEATDAAGKVVVSRRVLAEDRRA